MFGWTRRIVGLYRFYMAQQSFRHHYIPIFYLQAWTDVCGKLYEFSRPRFQVTSKHVVPKGTGFERHLYTIAGLPKEQQSVLEDKFFRDIDTTASDALRYMINTGGHNMNVHLRNGWSRFLNSLRQRQPEQVARLKKMSLERLEGILERVKVEAGSGKVPSLPAGVTFDQFAGHMRQSVRDKDWADVLQYVIDSNNVGLFISNMRWSLVNVQNSGQRFLTSDRPVVATNGVNHPEGYIMLPISPTLLFTALNNVEMENRLRYTDSRSLVNQVNDLVAKQAQRFVYSADERLLRFVEDRLGRSKN